MSTSVLIDALRITARRLREGVHYAWGNHGACNCGQLAQVLTPFTESEIRRFAQESRGEWTELAAAYCPDTKAPIDLILQRLQQAGLSPTDIHELEYLSNKEVLKRLPGGFRWLRRNVREDVILYFETFAGMLELQWQKTVIVAAMKPSDDITEGSILVNA